MKVKNESEVTQLCPTLHDPMACSLPGSSVHGSFQARVMEWGAIAFSSAGGGGEWLSSCYTEDRKAQCSDNSAFDRWKFPGASNPYCR